VLLYRLLAGQLPFPDDGGRSAIGPGAAPALEVPEWPGLGQLVGRMLAKDPVDRPRDGAAVVAALEALEPEGSSSQPGGTSSVRILRRARTIRWQVAAAIGATLLALLAAGGLYWRSHQAPADARPSVAVLPFTDLSEKQDQQYFSDGLAQEITSSLAQVEGLRVAGWTSAFAFRARMDDLRSLGRQLDVANVLVGSVRRESDRIRVTAQLVQTEDGRHLWSQTFERSLAGVFAVQDEIAGAVVAALEVQLLSGHQPTSREYRTDQPEVYLQYLQGRRYMERDTVPRAKLAAAAFQRAIDLDPNYAPAWARLSYATFWAWGNVGQSAAELEAAKRKAELAAERAVELAPQLAEAYAARAFLRSNLHQDWAGARADLERALRLSPGDPEMMWRFARIVLGPTGRLEEGVSLARRATQLDPMRSAPWTTLAILYLAQERLELARSAALRSLELLPEQDSAPTYLAAADLLEKKPEAAMVAARRSPEQVFHLQFEAAAYHDMGRPRESQAALDRIIAEHGADAPFQIACVYAWRGEADKAFEWLERSLNEQDGGIADLRLEPMLRGLRKDPRYKALEKRIGLPTE
jgi:TolB-like protein/tetratricopeptide (TPR) repeat protein